MSSLAITLLLVVAALGITELLPKAWRMQGFLGTNDVAGSESGQEDATVRKDVTIPIAWKLAVSGGAGLGIGGTVLLLLGLCGLISRPILIVLGVGFALLYLARMVQRQWLRRKRERSLAPSSAKGTESSKYIWGRLLCGVKIKYLALIVLPVSAGILLWITLLPVIEIDDIAYHLSVPKAYILEGRIFPIPLHLHSNWHLLSEMSSLWAFAFDPQDLVAPKLLELFRCLLLVVGVGGFGTWLYGVRTGMFSASCVIMMEEIARWGTLSHTDAGQALYLFLGIALLAGWLKYPDRWPALVAGSAFLGFGVAVKHTGIFIAATAWTSALIVRLVWIRRKVQDGEMPLKRMQMWKEFTWSLLPGLLILSPWLLKNTVFTGDPFYPFFVSRFQVPEDFRIPAEDFERFFGFDREPRSRGDEWQNWFHHIHAIVSNTRLLNANGLLVWGPVGVLFLILNRRRAQLTNAYCPASVFLAAASMLTIPFLLVSPYYRFFIGIYPVAVVICAGEGFRYLKHRWGARTCEIVGAILLLYFFLHFIDYNRYDQPSRKNPDGTKAYPGWTSASVKEQWRSLLAYALVEKINQTFRSGDRLLASTDIPTLPLINVRFVPNVPLVTREAITTLSTHGKSAEEIVGWMRRNKITHILTREPLDTGIPREFRDRFLEEIAKDNLSGIKLYRIR